jgi:hypothetical protein
VRGMLYRDAEDLLQLSFTVYFVAVTAVGIATPTPEIIDSSSMSCYGVIPHYLSGACSIQVSVSLHVSICRTDLRDIDRELCRLPLRILQQYSRLHCGTSLTSIVDSTSRIYSERDVCHKRIALTLQRAMLNEPPMMIYILYNSM